jgi:hypothetical protein
MCHSSLDRPRDMTWLVWTLDIYTVQLTCDKSHASIVTCTACPLDGRNPQ